MSSKCGSRAQHREKRSKRKKRKPSGETATCYTNRNICAYFFSSCFLYSPTCGFYYFYPFLKISSFLRWVQCLLQSLNKRTHCLRKVKFLSPQTSLAPRNPPPEAPQILQNLAKQKHFTTLSRQKDHPHTHKFLGLEKVALVS